MAPTSLFSCNTGLQYKAVEINRDKDRQSERREDKLETEAEANWQKKAG